MCGEWHGPRGIGRSELHGLQLLVFLLGWPGGAAAMFPLQETTWPTEIEAATRDHIATCCGITSILPIACTHASVSIPTGLFWGIGGPQGVSDGGGNVLWTCKRPDTYHVCLGDCMSWPPRGGYLYRHRQAFSRREQQWRRRTTATCPAAHASSRLTCRFANRVMSS